jgi:hypothetical protein
MGSGPQRYYTLCRGAAKQDGQQVEGNRFRLWETKKIRLLYEKYRPVFGDKVILRYLGKKTKGNGQTYKDFAITVIDKVSGKKKEPFAASTLPYDTPREENSPSAEADTHRTAP